MESDIERMARKRPFTTTPLSEQEKAERRMMATLREQEARQRRVDLMERFGEDD